MTRGVFNIQIQTGKLLPLGIVDPSSVQWQNPPSDLTSNVFEIDFDARSWALGNVYLDEHVMTGVKLEKIDNNVIIHTIVGKKILNLATGEIDHSSAVQTKYDYDMTSQVPLKGRKVGLDYNSKRYTVDAAEQRNLYDKRIHFTTSDYAADKGMMMVPYFDGNDVQLDQPRPLSGVGFIYYSNEGYAGYIRPVLKVFNYKYLIPM